MKRILAFVVTFGTPSSLLLKGANAEHSCKHSDEERRSADRIVRFTPPMISRAKKETFLKPQPFSNPSSIIYCSTDHLSVNHIQKDKTHCRRGSLPAARIGNLLKDKQPLCPSKQLPNHTVKIIEKSSLRPGMWGTETYQLPAYTFDVSQLTPLTKEMVATPFFAKLEKASTKKRIELLEVATQYPGGHTAYLARRYNIAAILLSGTVCLPAVQEENKNTLCWKGLLSQAVFFNDMHLTELLLAHGADVHEKHDPLARSPLYKATTASIARQLIAHGALKDSKHTQRLLHETMSSVCSADLVGEYIANGFDPMERLNNRTPLSYLIDEFTYPEMAKKAELLLSRLSAAKIRVLLNNIDDKPGTAFTRIANKQVCPRMHSHLEALFNVLVEKGKAAGMPAELFGECILCSDMLCKKPMRVTMCKHRFHATCVRSYRSCPLCRTPLDSEKKEQKQKNEMLIRARIYPAGISKYAKRRNLMIEALHFGADIQAVQKQFAQEKRVINLLRQATEHGDCELMQLMIECGADIHEPDQGSQAPALFYAKNLPEAKLLVGYGALNHPRTQQDLLVRAGGKDYAPKLITYYKKKGITPTQQDHNGQLVLMEIIWHSFENRLDKIKRVIDNISPKELATLLTTKNKSRKENVFDCIKRAQKNPQEMHSDEEPEVVIAKLEEVAHYLREKEIELSAQSVQNFQADVLYAISANEPESPLQARERKISAQA